MEGLWRLISQNGFTQTRTQIETEIEFNRVSNPPNAFIMEMGILCKTLVTTRATTLKAYEEYCEDIGVAADAKALTQAMNGLAPKIRDGWTYKPKKERIWLGFGLKNSDEQLNMEQMEQMEHVNPLAENNSDKNILECKTRVPSVPSVPWETEQKQRFCSVECVNFDRPSCQASNWQSLNKLSEVPLRCPGYSQIGSEEER